MKKIISTILSAMCAFFVGCAEVEYGDYEGEIIEIIEIIDEEANSTNQNTKPKPAKKPIKNKSLKIQSKKDLNKKDSGKKARDSNKSAIQRDAIRSQDSQTSKNISDSVTLENVRDTNNLNDSHNAPKDLSDSNEFVGDSLDVFESQMPKDSPILNKSKPQTKPFFDISKLNQPIATLKTACDSKGDLQKCEDLGRIYAVQEKRDLATAHYKIACAKGKGRIMSCFFNSLIFANNGDDATSREYLDAIDADTLSALKIDEAELMLSIGEIALIKDKLKISCASGESTSCNALLSVFKIRGELGEARAFFGVECKRVKKQNSTPCVILKNL